MLKSISSASSFSSQTRFQSRFEPKGRRVSSSSSTSSISTWRLYPNDLAGAAGGVASRCTATRLRDASENGPWDGTGRSCLDLGENRVPSILGTIAFPWNNRAKNGTIDRWWLLAWKEKNGSGGTPLMRCLRSRYESNREMMESDSLEFFFNRFADD